MDIKLKQEIALFKFSLIAPLVNGTFNQKSQMEYFRDVAKKTHKVHSGKEVQYASMTIKKWYLDYMKNGLESLEPKSRNDAGIPRTLTSEVIKKINDIRNTFPHITGKLIYHKLIEEGILKSKTSSLSTVLRYLRENNLKSSQYKTEETKAFEMESSNNLWQADSSTGPCLKINGVSKKTYIIAIIDDASRMITHAEIFYEDNGINVQKVLKKAISKYGVPHCYYVDNGTPYRNDQLKNICASLGISLIHHTPYSPNKKGKIERVFRTIKDNWMNGIDWNKFNSLASANESINQFLSENYTNTIHSSLNCTPRERYMQDADNIKYLPSKLLDFYFLHKISRKVFNDATIRIDKRVYEVPQKYIGQKLVLKYEPNNFEIAYVIDHKNNITDEIKILNKVENSKIKRVKKIDYAENKGE